MKKLMENNFLPFHETQPQNTHPLQENTVPIQSINHVASVFSLSVHEKKNTQQNINIKKNLQFKNSQKLFPHKDKRQSKEQKKVLFKTLQDKQNIQQVSSLYSEHIYKSFQKDYFNEAQLQKYKIMLANQKKIKMKLLAQKNEWNIQKAKLMEEKKIILFALDSMTVKLDFDNGSGKKKKQLKRQTASFLKQKFYTNENSNQNVHQNMDEFVFKTDLQLAQNEGISQDGKIMSSLEKLKQIKQLKEKLNLDKNLDLDKIINDQEQAQAKIIQLQQKQRKSVSKMKKLEHQNQSLEFKILQMQNKIQEKQQQIEELKQINKQITNKNKCQQQITKKSNLQINRLAQQIKALKEQNKKNMNKIQLLQKQLNITKQQYRNREEKQKQCVKMMQRFSKDLKLSDQKIKQFLTQQFNTQTLQNHEQLNRSSKTYNQHLSYILHLCKKKQSLYENLVEEFKQKMKQDNFLVSILEKKLNHYSKHQQKLRELVQADSDKDLIYRTIMRFGH